MLVGLDRFRISLGKLLLCGLVFLLFTFKLVLNVGELFTNGIIENRLGSPLVMPQLTACLDVIRLEFPLAMLPGLEIFLGLSKLVFDAFAWIRSVSFAWASGRSGGRGSGRSSGRGSGYNGGAACS